jgi:CelD/BcsL family acetyltransferase involved in cellulose biosynthesis/predicted ATP-grasp superfamily ATP-dependent carboligase
MKVLVTDGDNRAALAVTRSLGRAGHEVIVGERRAPSLAGVSRYCASPVVYPDPIERSEEFVDTVAALVSDHRIEAILPVADISTFLVTANAARFGPNCAVPFATAAAVARAADKVDVMQIASRLGVPVPATIVVCDPSRVPETDWPYPVVIKPRQSRIRTATGWVSTSVSYAGSRDELLRDLAARPRHEFPVMLQERINGAGMGVFACYDEGHPVALFSHRRVRERPPWGGVSVLSESVALDPQAKKYATQLLDELEWQGVAMVEFKIDERDGQPKLMEINGRFWGSLQLAIDAGVDFPALLVRTLTQKPIGPPPTYRAGVRSRWLWGDIDALLLTLFAGSRAAAWWQPHRISALLEFMKLAGPRLHYDNPKLDDFRPWLLETRRRLQEVGPAVLNVSDAAVATHPGTVSRPRPLGMDTRSRVFASPNETGLSATRWNALLGSSHTNSIFQTYQWHDSWWRTYGRKLDGRFIAVSDDATCLAVAPMALHRSTRDRVLRFAGDGRADYCDFITPHDKPEVLSRICDALRAETSWNILELNNVPAHSATIAAVQNWSKDAGYFAYVRPQFTCSALVVEGHEAEANAIVNKASLRRKTNSVRRLGRLETRDFRRSADVLPHLDGFFAQHVKRWEMTATPSLFLEQRQRDFYRDLTLAMDGTDWLLFSVVTLDDRPIAMHYGFDYNGVVTWYKPSFDVAYAAHSPGMIMVRHLVEQAIANRRREFDLTIGDEAFKRRFANAVRSTARIQVFRERGRYMLERSRRGMASVMRQLSR